VSAMPNRCSADQPRFDVVGPQWNGWSNEVDNSRFQSAQSAGLAAERVPQLKLKWAFGFPGGTSAYGPPTVVGGRLFVGSDNGYVYAVDSKTGCVYWSFQAKSGVRTAVIVAQ
jgi:polyvinyl alcohol dehydrogenase (cytochrome)